MDSDTPSAISGAACTEARKILDWSQRDLARAAGISHRTVVRIESARDRVTRSLAARAILFAFAENGISIEYQDSAK